MLGRMRRRRQELEAQLRRGRPQQALDHHHESDRNDKIAHRFG